jgi:hypothetical protein
LRTKKSKPFIGHDFNRGVETASGCHNRHRRLDCAAAAAQHQPPLGPSRCHHQGVRWQLRICGARNHHETSFFRKFRQNVYIGHCLVGN